MTTDVSDKEIRRATDGMHTALGGIEQATRQMRDSLQLVQQNANHVRGMAQALRGVAATSRILAINASIEATAAGENGRSFGVVAEEFGRLANEIAKIASAADSTLTDSTTTAQTGAAASEQIGESLNQLVQKQQSVEHLLFGEVKFDPETMGTGDATIDNQHRKLIDMINQLSVAIQNGDGKEKLKPTLDFMANYVVEHFQHEEGVMTRHRCKVSEGNKKAHQNLLDFYGKWREQFDQDGASIAMVSELQRFLGNWVVSHIQKVDSCLATCVKKQIAPSKRTATQA